LLGPSSWGELFDIFGHFNVSNRSCLMPRRVRHTSRIGNKNVSRRRASLVMFLQDIEIMSFSQSKYRQKGE
jgi:hypothetical protein